MKKLFAVLALMAICTVLVSSCRVHKGCEAYSKVETKPTKTRI